MGKRKVTSEEFDAKFNTGEDITDLLIEVDPNTFKPKKTKVSAELPPAMVQKIDAIGAKTGNTRNAVIRTLIAKALEDLTQENLKKL